MHGIRSQRVYLNGVVKPATVWIENGKIVSVDNLNSADASSNAILDLGNRLLTPAFVNAHTHLALVCLRGYSERQKQQPDKNMVEDFFFAVEEKLTEQDIYAFAKMGAYESILNGVGLVWDHYYGADAVVQAAREVGLSIVMAPTLQDLSGPGKNDWQKNLDLTERLHADQSLASQGVFAALGPHATDTVSEALWKTIVETAGKKQLPIHAHLAQSLEEYKRAEQRYRKSPTQFLSDIGAFEEIGVYAHNIYVDRHDLARLNGKQTLVYCPYSQMVFGFPARVDHWRAQNIRWAVATDCAASNDSMNILKELRFVAGQDSLAASYSQQYLDFFQAADLAKAEAIKFRPDNINAFEDNHAILKKVWQTPGEIHPAFRAGIIEQGALANLIVWKENHPSLWPDEISALPRADASMAIDGIWNMGKMIGELGDFHQSLIGSDDYQQTVRQANLAMKRIQQFV